MEHLDRVGIWWFMRSWGPVRYRQLKETGPFLGMSRGQSEDDSVVRCSRASDRWNINQKDGRVLAFKSMVQGGKNCLRACLGVIEGVTGDRKEAGDCWGFFY